MTKEEFIDKIVSKGWEWAEEDGKIYIKLINEKVVETQDKFSDALIRHIGSFDVYGMSRIVGYYSKIQNWNKSKLGELQDRQDGAKKGSYTL